MYPTQNISNEKISIMGQLFDRQLNKYPVWAIDRAFDWWLSSRNPDCRFAPVVGAIEARILKETNIVKIMAGRIKWFDNPPKWLEAQQAPPHDNKG